MAINAEITDLKGKIDQYDSKISEIRKDFPEQLPDERKLIELKQNLSELTNQKTKLGIFAGKQKKQLQEQIDSLQRQITDLSIKETISEDWKSNARRRIKGCDVVVVICGKCTDSATGVSAELRIAQDENIPYFLLGGRSGEVCVKPTAAKESDKVYKWTWDNLKRLIGGAR